MNNSSKGPSSHTGVKNIDACIDECMTNMKSWGLLKDENITWTVKQMESMGKTTWFKKGEIQISINIGLVMQSSGLIQDTVYHELAHVSAGYRAGHGDKWKKIIKIIAQKTGLQLSILGAVKEVTNRYWYDGGYKYIARCKKCGQIIGFMKRNEFVKKFNAWDAKHCCPRFTHTGCGGEWELINKGGK